MRFVRDRGNDMNCGGRVEILTRREMVRKVKESMDARDARDGEKRTRWQRFRNWIDGTPYRRFD